MPSRWSRARRAAEAVLADGEWHTFEELYAVAEDYIRPEHAVRQAEISPATVAGENPRVSFANAFRRARRRALREIFRETKGIEREMAPRGVVARLRRVNDQNGAGAGERVRETHYGKLWQGITMVLSDGEWHPTSEIVARCRHLVPLEMAEKQGPGSLGRARSVFQRVWSMANSRKGNPRIEMGGVPGERTWRATPDFRTWLATKRRD